jgi:hypothetical protein
MSSTNPNSPRNITASPIRIGLVRITLTPEMMLPITLEAAIPMTIAKNPAPTRKLIAYAPRPGKMIEAEIAAAAKYIPIIINLWISLNAVSRSGYCLMICSLIRREKYFRVIIAKIEAIAKLIRIETISGI